jgi:uncharacterized damage-inducible protein DinB
VASRMPSEIETFRSWFAYLADTRQGYLAVFERLPAAELARDRGASHPSLLDVFLHSAGAIYFWIEGSSTTPFPKLEKEPSEPPTLAEVREFETYIQERVREFMGGLKESDLVRTVPRKKGHGSDHDCEVPVREVLWHLVEEELQHLGELNALLWQIDVDAPVLNWIAWSHRVGRIRDSRTA